jgi:7-carboxy-7-deazaguanine synthase
MYAVDPAEVRRNSEALSTEDILQRLEELGGTPRWVVLSGGNPALHELAPLVERLHGVGQKVAVETQGSVWRRWLSEVDRLTISPKPPSSGMATPSHRNQFEEFMSRALANNSAGSVLKIVCFDQGDLVWAKEISSSWPDVDLYLSAGTPVPSPADLRAAVAARYRWLCERVSADEDLGGARVLPQLHVIAWGDATGV